ncbi:MAG: MBL fold metallo-hydrolase [Bacteroidales bacterium]|nr:MBL fold metallo-hydrolase [Bacteroidales bacterium]
MRTQLKSLFCLIMLTVPFSLTSQQNQTSPVTLVKIGDNLYETRGGSGANGGVFIGDYGVLLIDTKMNQVSVDQVLNEVRKLTDKPVKFMVNTHSDGDHVAGNKFLPESVIIVAHENCRKEFFHPGRNGEASAWNDPSLAKYVPSATFDTKMDLYVDPKKVELLYFGTGHTTGDIAVYFADQKIAFIGDQVFKGRVQLIHSYKGGNSFKHVETLEKMLASIDAEKFYSGHSEALTREDIIAHIKEMKEFQAKVSGLVKKNYSLDKIKNEFNKDQANLVETVYNEITAVR